MAMIDSNQLLTVQNRMSDIEEAMGEAHRAIHSRISDAVQKMTVIDHFNNDLSKVWNELRGLRTDCDYLTECNSRNIKNINKLTKKIEKLNKQMQKGFKHVGVFFAKD